MLRPGALVTPPCQWNGDSNPQKRLAKTLTRFSSPPPRGRPLQESFIKLVDACNDTSLNMDRWLSRLESCRWLSHVKAALSTACLAAQCVDR